MKTLSDFKKRLKIGVELKATHHLSFAGRNPETGEPIYTDKDMGTRAVSIVQTNSFALKTNKKEPVYGRDEFGNRIETGEYTEKIVDSWCQYPKASEVVFKDENTITILEQQRDGKMIPVLTYQFV